MPSKSRKQQRFMGMIHAYQKGELKDASPSVKKASKSIDPDDAKHFAMTKHKGLPEKVKKKKKKMKNESTILKFGNFINEDVDEDADLLWELRQEVYDKGESDEDVIDFFIQYLGEEKSREILKALRDRN